MSVERLKKIPGNFSFQSKNLTSGQTLLLTFINSGYKSNRLKKIYSTIVTRIVTITQFF